MYKSQKVIYIIATLASIFVIVFGLWVGFTPSGRVVWNSRFNVVQKADDSTNYET